MLETVRTFTALSEEFVEESLRLWPVRATAAGIHDYDHLLPDDSAEGLRAQAAWLRDLEQRLAASVPWEELPAEQRVDYALLRSRLAVLRAGIEEMHTPARDPVACVRTALDGVFLLVARPFAPLEERKEAIVARLMAIPDYLGSACAGPGEAPESWVGAAAGAAAGGLVLVGDVVRALHRAFPHEVERIEHAGTRASAGLTAFREALLRGPGPRAAVAVALGARWLAFLLEREHLLPLGCDAIEALGREHVALVGRRLEEEARRLDPRRPWREQLEEARRHSRTEQADETRSSGSGRLHEAIETESARARRFVLERGLAPVPETRLEVIEAPAYARTLLPPLSYLPPAPFDLEPVGALLVGADHERDSSAEPDPTPRPERDRGPRPGGAPAPAPAALGLAIGREAWPGRHLQAALAAHCGSRLRRLGDSSLFADGWALYAEELMVEEGFVAASDARLLMLGDLLLSAARAVVDVGVHTGRMSPVEATDWLAGEAVLERAAAAAEVLRCTLEPARLLGGFVGRLQILELRDEARRRLGAKFDRLDFHAALLAGGTLPLALLREEIWARLGVSG